LDGEKLGNRAFSLRKTVGTRKDGDKLGIEEELEKGLTG